MAKDMKNISFPQFILLTTELNLFSMIDASTNHTFTGRRRVQPYIVGYSGYIPGMSFQYGHTFGRAAEDCIDMFTRQQAVKQSRQEAEQERRAKSLPRMKSAVGAKVYSNQSKPYVSPYGPYGRMSPMYPPIPGYTGYIPLMKSSDGIGRTYSAAARKGLSQVIRARERRQAQVETTRSNNV